MPRHRKASTACFHLYEVSKIVTFINSKTGTMVARGRGAGTDGELLIN